MNGNKVVRRKFLEHAAAGAASARGDEACYALARARAPLQAGAAKIKVGLMLPYTGTYAPLGVAIENGLRLALQESGGKLGGREVDFAKVDDESEPAKATDNINRLITRDKVDVVMGTVHSGVAAAMIRVTREAGVLHIIPNAGLARRDRAALRAEHLPHVVLQLAVGLRDGRRAGRPAGVRRW